MREIDVEIFGKADTRTTVDIAESERLKEKIEPGIICNGPEAEIGNFEDQVSPVDPKATLTQVQNLQFFQVGPTKSILNGKRINKRSKSPTRRKPHAHTAKSGKENVGLCLSTVPKESAKVDATRMEVKERDEGPKWKIRAPLSEAMDNMKVGKKLKLDGEVVALGKLLATQMGSVTAGKQPRREQ